MRIGINSTPEHSSPEMWADLLVEHGFRATAFPLDYHADVHTIDAYVKAAADRDILIAEVGVWNSPHHPDPQIREAAYERCLEQFRLAEYIHARCCVNVSGAAGEHWFACYPANYDESLYARNVELLQKLCDTVRPQHTCYALETMQWMVPSSAEDYVRILRDVDRPGFKVHMDICNLISTPWRYTHQRAVIDEAFDALGPRIVSCHIKDLRQRIGISVAIDEVPIGTGAMDLGYYLDKVDALAPDMPVLIEHLDRFEDYVQARQVIREKWGR